MFTLLWFAGIIEIDRRGHAGARRSSRGRSPSSSRDIWPSLISSDTSRVLRFRMNNGGNLPILYCFVFFYLAFAGGGPWSVDAMRGKK